MKKLLTFIFYIVAMGTVTPMASYAQDDVHFGTIFVEDIEYQNSEENTGINHLTDQSAKQEQLETLYKQEIGQPNEKLKKLDMAPRQPASTPEHLKNSQKVGVVRNAELPQKVVYFIELRSFEGNDSVTIHQQANPSSQPILRLQPGEMVKIIDSPDQYIHKMRMDRDNQGVWKKLATREEDIQNPALYYDWRNFSTITSHDFPIEMDIMVPYGRNSIPVFNRPGAWTWKDCGLNENLCTENIDIHTRAYLFDATIIDARLSQNQVTDYRLFYKIGYQIKDKNGVLQHHVGWIPSTHAKRKISQLPKSLIATRSPDSLGTYESDAERLQRLQKYYVFDSNMNSENRTMSRWLDKTPGQSAEVFFQNIAFDGVANYSYFNLKQDFALQSLGEAFVQQGVALGAGIYAPIFIDLEIQGTATLTVPIEANENGTYKKAPIFRGEQWLLYTTPLSVSGVPFKFGVGAYYISMFASQLDFGFNSLVGFQGKVLFENDRFWTGARYGPTGQDFDFRFENRELGFDFGYRLNPERRYESWSVFGDFSDTNYNSSSIDNSTKFQIISIGVRKQF